MNVDDEALDYLLYALLYFLEHHGAKKRFEAAQEVECEVWGMDEDPEVNDSTVVKVTCSPAVQPKSWEITETLGVGIVNHFEYDNGKVTSTVWKDPENARKRLFEFAVETIAFSQFKNKKE